jgi:hypothetical protein
MARELSASLQWANSRTLSSGGVLTEAWASSVRPAFDPTTVADEVGMSLTISAKPVRFPIPSGQQVSLHCHCHFGDGIQQRGRREAVGPTMQLQARCLFVYSTLKLAIPFTITTKLLYDKDGNSTWTTSTSVNAAQAFKSSQRAPARLTLVTCPAGDVQRGEQHQDADGGHFLN